ncbi:MAG: hypothetical protein GC153_13300 [Alphaproteobacteria bacterium]|nr:hypothetical protein [Alphaproteobacteria bacterium]
MAERLIDKPPAQAAAKRAFIDLEASGLGAKSWPVEVGWAFETGEPTSMLVRPDNSWSDDAWDPKAEALHGLSRDRLEREGRPAQDVCAAMNAALAGCEVYSDAPDWDGFWLFRLYSAAGAKQAFALRDYGRLMRPLTAGCEPALFVRASRLAPRRHRAAADARHLQTLYRLALESRR